MIILSHQLRALEAYRQATFRPRMVQHLGNHFHELAQICGEEGFEKLIEDALPRVEALGLHSSYEACIFIDQTVMLGRGFDSDPLLPWVAKILAKPGTDKTVWMEQLMQSSLKFRTRLLGAEKQFPETVFKKIIQADYEAIEDQIKPLSAPQFLNYLADFWPEKFALVEEQNLEALGRKAAAVAPSYGITSPEGLRYFWLLQYLLGHQFDRDFQYEWLMNILNDPRYDTEYYKLCSLHFTLQQYFESLMETPELSN